uniref:Uncharacterized protein n=1 Tax=Trypanosoma congolense (strain IL3000) TaxID=1068625 RepID=G0UYB4_TRYCI|nr:conserved hypothetical protein [Trypanosoma congolense IL3000]
MNVNLDSLFGSKSNVEPSQSSGYVPPPPPCDPPPPPLMQQQVPFGVDRAPTVPPPPFESVVSTPVAPATHYKTTPQQQQPIVQSYAPNIHAATAPNISAGGTVLPVGAAYSQPFYQLQPPPAAPVVPPSPQTMCYAQFPQAAMPYGMTTSDPFAPSATPGVPVGVQPKAHFVSRTNVAEPITLKDASASLQEEEDRKQLEKIIQLRKELEKEREKELKKREELETWGCPSCTYRNALDTNTCGMCDTCRPGYNPPANSAASVVSHNLVTPHSKALASVPTAPAGPTAWLCSMCSAPNEAHHTNCKMCNSYQRNGTPIVAAPGAPASSAAPSLATAWLCGICGKNNKASNPRCEACSSYKSKGTPIIDNSSPQGGTDGTISSEITWKCSVCTLENPVTSALCDACQSGQRPRHLAQPKKSHSLPEHEEDRSRGSQKWWSCGSCTFQNTWALERCEMCSVLRPSHMKPPPSATRPSKHEEGVDVQWQSDEAATACNRCHQPFTFKRRRHHCRACGYVFCGGCSPFTLPVRSPVPERVCFDCHEARK